MNVFRSLKRAKTYPLSLVNLVNLPAMVAVFSIFFVTACRKIEQLPDTTEVSGVLKECVLPSSQTNTFIGKWRSLAVPISIRTGDFTNKELAAIQRAIDTWNGFYKESKGIHFVLETVSSTSHTTQPAQGSCTDLALVTSQGQYTSPIVIFKISDYAAWTSSGYSPNQIAVTRTCSPSKSISSAMTFASMEVNFANFFGSNSRQPDLESIILHELGHVIGLDHPCDSTTSCSKITDPEVPKAAMFYTNNNEIKRSLSLNDQGRANCLY